MLGHIWIKIVSHFDLIMVFLNYICEIFCFNPLSAKKKMHLKMLSAEVVCCK